MEIKKTQFEKPKKGYNVFVKHTIEHQDFWTRGCLINKEWFVLTWRGTVKVPLSDIEEWAEIPNIIY